MAALNLLVQIIGICVGVYLAISRSLFKGIALVAIVVIGHLAFSKLANLFMLFHQKRLSENELHALQLQAQLGNAAVPHAWTAIGLACGFTYFCISVTAICLFLFT